MDKSLRATLILVAVIVLPLLIFSLFQANSLKEDEQLAQDIYEKQMETVLHSLNMYTDDHMDRWVRQLEDPGYTVHQNANSLVKNNESIQMLTVRKMQTRQDSISLNEYIEASPGIQTKIQNWYTAKDSVLNQLTKYLNAGFQKIQAADDWQSIDDLHPSQSGVTVMLYDRDSVLYNALIILESRIWVEQILGYKMQELSQNNFKLAVVQTTNKEDYPTPIFDTAPFEFDKDYITSELWILSNTHLAIQSIGQTYTEIVKARSQTNIYTLLASLSIMLIGTLYLVRNIRNTMKLAQLKSDFVSNVSHEIRTPLALIKMYSETLMLGRLPSEEKKQHYYHVIHHESGRLTYLVNNILDFSKIESNRKVYSKALQNMNDLVQNLYDNYSFTFKEKQVDCILNISPGTLDIEVDNQAFDEALSNLIENAIKYSTDPIKIEIKTEIQNGKVVCQVIDQGIGIQPRHQKAIFDKFYRIEGALTQKTKGAGLGLSLVKHIMEAHDGSIKMIANKDKGSTFTLIFPLTPTSHD
ncbi:MAG: ATP-binding protein [Reichenbachiella sp.]